MGTPSRLLPRPSTIGGFAGSLSLACLWVLRNVSHRFDFPPTALSDRIIRMTPGGVATFFIDKLQQNASRLLVVIVTMGFLLLAGVLPLVSSRLMRTHRAAVAGGLFGASAFAAAAVAPSRSSVWALIPGLTAASVYSLTFRWLGRTGRRPTAPEGATITRRQALSIIGASAVAVALIGSAVGRVLARIAGPNTNIALRAPDRRAVIPTSRARTSFPNVPGLAPEVTSVADHYVVDIDLLNPTVDASTWRLAVGGLVRKPLSLTLADLQSKYEVVEEYAVLTCISNYVGGPLIGNSRWSGVRLSDVLGDAGLRAGARTVVFRAVDGYHSSLPLEAALDPSVLLAIAQEGAPLKWEHGFPCRLRAPAFYGVKNAKWLRRVEVVGGEHEDFWTQRGWSNVARVRTESRIDTNGPFTAGQRSWIGGAAWAGDRGISRVDVSLDDGGTWEPALLKPPISRWSWTQWGFAWTPARPGSYRLRCRATDGTETLQDRVERPPHPSGASGYDEVEVQVR